jgi:hypothetical protein
MAQFNFPTLVRNSLPDKELVQVKIQEWEKKNGKGWSLHPFIDIPFSI